MKLQNKKKKYYNKENKQFYMDYFNYYKTTKLKSTNQIFQGVFTKLFFKNQIFFI